MSVSVDEKIYGGFLMPRTGATFDGNVGSPFVQLRVSHIFWLDTGGARPRRQRLSALKGPPIVAQGRARQRATLG